jgi:hypothetical protein
MSSNSINHQISSLCLIFYGEHGRWKSWLGTLPEYLCWALSIHLKERTISCLQSPFPSPSQFFETCQAVITFILMPGLLVLFVNLYIGKIFLHFIPTLFFSLFLFLTEELVILRILSTLFISTTKHEARHYLHYHFRKVIDFFPWLPDANFIT